MHDLNVINRLNHDAHVESIIKARAAGLHVVARYEGSRLISTTTFDKKEAAERFIAEVDTPDSRNAGTHHQLFAATATN